MNRYFLFILFLCSINLNAQNLRLKEHGALPPAASFIAHIPSFHYSDIIQGDINEDGLEDIIICGKPNNYSPETRVYLQDRHNNFIQSNQYPFTGVSNGKILLKDFNSDGHPDFFICGRGNYSTAADYIADLYLNDGAGHFSKKSNTPFLGVTSSCLNSVDVNGDQYPDIIYSGRTYADGDIFHVYLNDGNANFSFDSSNMFTGLVGGDVHFVDLNGDGIEDIIGGGFPPINPLFSGIKIFLNNGSGQYLEKVQAFPRINGVQIRASDLDHDGDVDFIASAILLKYNPYANIRHTYTYLNDGTGLFTEHIDSTIFGFGGDIELADFTGDSIPDLIMLGSDSNGKAHSYLLKGTSGPSFEHYDTLDFQIILYAKLKMLHLNQDSKPDFIYLGNQYSYLMLNKNSAGIKGFEKLQSSPFIPNKGSRFEFADLNNDGHTDVIQHGIIEWYVNFYLNDGIGNLNQDTSYHIIGPSRGILYYLNMDADTLPDIVMSTTNKNGYDFTIYKNDGNKHFIASDSVAIRTHQYFRIADLKGNGLHDILDVGTDSNSLPVFQLYRNDGNGHMVYDSSAIIEGLWLSNAEFGDINGDHAIDLITTGQDTGGLQVSRVYLNDGTGKLLLHTNHGLGGFLHSGIKMADLDLDGDMDVIMAGQQKSSTWSSDWYTRIYWNDGSAHFTEVLNHNIQGYTSPNITLSDFNYDGYPDVQISGYTVYNSFHLKIENYQYMGNGRYVSTNLPFEPTYGIFSSTIDLDKDGQYEFILGGRDEYQVGLGRLYTILNCTTQRSTDSIHACDSFEWINRKTYYASNYTDSTILIGDNGCDSVIYLALTLGNSDTSNLQVSTCDSFQWLDNKWYSADTSLSYILDNQSGCDSLVNLTLFRNYSNSYSFSQLVCDSFLWIDGRYYFSDTSLIFILTNQSGCDSSVQVTLDRHDVDISTTLSHNSITANDTGVQYLWLDCQSSFQSLGATSQTYFPVVNGDYAVQIDDGTCIDTSACITFATLGHEIIKQDDVKVYPSPTHSSLSVEYPENTVSLEILSIQGAVLYQESCGENRISVIPVQQLAPGTYILHAIHTNHHTYIRFVKE